MLSALSLYHKAEVSERQSDGAKIRHAMWLLRSLEDGAHRDTSLNLLGINLDHAQAGGHSGSAIRPSNVVNGIKSSLDVRRQVEKEGANTVARCGMPNAPDISIFFQGEARRVKAHRV